MSGKIIESIEYKTDIITSYSGKEQRIKTRQIPRKVYSYDYSSMQSYQAHWLRGMTRMKKNEAKYIPMWHDVAYLRDDFVANGKALYIDKTYMYNFDNCEYIEIFVEDDVYQSGINFVREVASYSDGIIRLKQKIPRDLLKENTWIYPLKKVSVKEASEINYVFSNGTEMTLNFEEIYIKSKYDIPYNYRNVYDYVKEDNLYNLPETYNNREILTISPQWLEDGDTTLKVDKNVERLDNDTGIILYDLKSTYSYDTQTFDIYLSSQKSINNMKKFFYKMCGMYKSFYAPSWVNDFQLDRDVSAGDNFLYTRFDSLYKFYLGVGRNKSIVIFKKNFTCTILDISAYTYETVGDITYGKIILASPVMEQLSVDDVFMISYLNLVRFDSDELKLDYESNVVANTTLLMKEVDDEQ